MVVKVTEHDLHLNEWVRGSLYDWPFHEDIILYSNQVYNNNNSDCLYKNTQLWAGTIPHHNSPMTSFTIVQAVDGTPTHRSSILLHMTSFTIVLVLV